MDLKAARSQTETGPITLFIPSAKLNGSLALQIKQAENGFFYIHWTEGRRSKRSTTHVRDLPAACLVLGELLLGQERAAARKRGPTCGDLWATYMVDHVARNCVSDEAQRHAWAALEGRFAPLRPAEVTFEVVQAHIAARHPVGTFNEFALLHASWRFGVKRRKLEAADLPIISDLGFPREPLPRERWFRHDEIRSLFQAAAEMRGGERLSRIERFMWLALETAGRRTALLELKWTQVDFETNVVHLNPEGRRQTSKRRASVPISDALLVMLNRAYAERQTDYVLDRPSKMHELLQNVAKRAGVKGATAHVFRHTAATLMARRNVSLFKISKVLGCSVEEVEKTYAKHRPDDLRDCVNLISGGNTVFLIKR